MDKLLSIDTFLLDLDGTFYLGDQLGSLTVQEGKNLGKSLWGLVFLSNLPFFSCVLLRDVLS